MRCEDAVHHALLTNPSFRNLPWVRDTAVANVTRHFRSKYDTTAYLMVLPRDAARMILTEHMPRIVRTQKSTGGWKVNGTQRISLGYLRAFEYAGMLAEFLRALRHDPYKLFCDGADVPSYVARNRFLGKPLPADATLRQSLIHGISQDQRGNGSWDDSVLATTFFVHELLDLGLDPTCNPIESATRFLFSCLLQEVERHSPNHGGVVVAHDMFTNDNRHVEFQAATRYRPYWNPAGSCYNHLPVVQSAMAIKCLNATGFESDARVLAACNNLVEIHGKYGGFCDTMIRIGIIADRKRDCGRHNASGRWGP